MVYIWLCILSISIGVSNTQYCTAASRTKSIPLSKTKSLPANKINSKSTIIKSQKSQQVKSSQVQDSKVVQKKSVKSISATPAPTATQAVKQTRVVKITNAITSNMLKYKYGFVNYSPDPFNIIINGTVLTQGTTGTFSIKNNILKARYEYSFAGGMYKGFKEVEYSVDADADTLELTFNWHDNCRIKISNSHPISA